MEFIETSAAPLPAGHYSQAVAANGMVFVSGQLPIVPGIERHIPEGVEAQLRQVFANLRGILLAADSDLDRLLSVQLFISDIALWEPINTVYREILGMHKPARTVIPCGPLHYGALLELNAIALAGARQPHCAAAS